MLKNQAAPFFPFKKKKNLGLKKFRHLEYNTDVFQHFYQTVLNQEKNCKKKRE